MKSNVKGGDDTPTHLNNNDTQSQTAQGGMDFKLSSSAIWHYWRVGCELHVVYYVFKWVAAITK